MLQPPLQVIFVEAAGVIVGHRAVPTRHAARPCRAGTALRRAAACRRAGRAVPGRAMGQAFGP